MLGFLPFFFPMIVVEMPVSGRNSGKKLNFILEKQISINYSENVFPNLYSCYKSSIYQTK